AICKRWISKFTSQVGVHQDYKIVKALMDCRLVTICGHYRRHKLLVHDVFIVISKKPNIVSVTETPVHFTHIQCVVFVFFVIKYSLEIGEYTLEHFQASFETLPKNLVPPIQYPANKPSSYNRCGADDYTDGWDEILELQRGCAHLLPL